MFNMAYVLQFVVDRLNDGSLPKHYLVIKVHQRVLHILPDFCDQMYVVHEEALEEILADVSPVGKELSKEPLRELFVFQRFAVVAIPRCELPLYDFTLVVDDQMKLETIKPSHRAFPFLSPSRHGLVHVHPLDMAGHQRRGVYDGDARTLAQSARMEEQQQVEADLGLTFHETVVGDNLREFLAHVLTDIAQIERLQIPEVAGVKQDEDGHDFAVGHAPGTVAMVLPRDRNSAFLQFRLKIFAEFVEKTKNFNYICSRHRSVDCL